MFPFGLGFLLGKDHSSSTSWSGQDSAPGRKTRHGSSSISPVSSTAEISDCVRVQWELPGAVARRAESRIGVVLSIGNRTTASEPARPYRRGLSRFQGSAASVTGSKHRDRKAPGSKPAAILTVLTMATTTG